MRPTSKRTIQLAVKRALDVSVSGIALLVLSPLMGIIALLVVLESPGGAIYRSRRVGRFGEEFDMLKFRTLVLDADHRGKLTPSDDDRQTRVGSLLRRFKLDELPQLVNVLKGEMSLVGPRPEVPEYVHHYTQQQRRVLSMRPGITDEASLRYRHEGDLLASVRDPERLYLEELLPDKLSLGLEYVENWSLAGDLRLIARTLIAITGRKTKEPPVRPHGADEKEADSPRSGHPGGSPAQ